MAQGTYIGIRVPVVTKQEWLEKAKEEGRSLSNWIQHTIRQATASFTEPLHDAHGKRRR